MLVYEVDSEADAGVIFETMNNRGKPITELEKVKNYLLYISSKLSVDSDCGVLAREINDTWQHIFERLMSSGLGDQVHEDRLLRAHWLTVYDYREKAWEGSGSIKNRFALATYQRRHAELYGEIWTYVETLRNAATAYCDVMSPLSTNAYGNLNDVPELQRDVILVAAKFRRLDVVANFMPIMLGARLRYSQDGNLYLALVSLCDCFAFRVHGMPSSRSNTAAGQLISIGFDIYHGMSLDEALTKIQRLLHSYSPDHVFEQHLRNRDMDWYYWNSLRYFLYDYEEYLAGLRGVPVHMPWDYLVDPAHRNKTIEHVLPRNPEEDSYWTERFNPESHRLFSKDLGNLSLTYDNSRLGRLPFRGDGSTKTKREYYDASALFIERDLATFEDWGPGAISERREAMVSWALQRWAVPIPAPEKQADPSNLLESILQRVDEYGYGGHVRLLLEMAQRHRIYYRVRKRSIMFAPNHDKRLAMFTIWPQRSYVWMFISHDQIARRIQSVTRESVASEFGAEYQSLEPNRFGALVTNLVRAFDVS